MTQIKCSHCDEPGLRRLRTRRHGFGRKYRFSCPKCGKGAGYDDVPAIISTFALAILGQGLLWGGIQLGKYPDVPQAIFGASIVTVLILGYGAFQVWGRKKFLAAHPGAQV